MATGAYWPTLPGSSNDTSSASRARGPADFEADIPLASLPAGDYLLEVALPGEQSPAKQLVAFRVTS